MPFRLARTFDHGLQEAYQFDLVGVGVDDGDASVLLGDRRELCAGVEDGRFADLPDLRDVVVAVADVVVLAGLGDGFDLFQVFSVEDRKAGLTEFEVREPPVEGGPRLGPESSPEAVDLTVVVSQHPVELEPVEEGDHRRGDEVPAVDDRLDATGFERFDGCLDCRDVVVGVGDHADVHTGSFGGGRGNCWVSVETYLLGHLAETSIGMGRHLIVVVLLVGLALASGIHYDAGFDRHWEYPTEEDLSSDYESHVGERTLVWGVVQSIDRDASEAVVEVDSDDGEFELLVRGLDADVEPGGTVQVYGSLEPDQTLVASGFVVVERSPADRLFKYGLSAGGAALALGIFFRYWRIDWRRLRFEPRRGSEEHRRAEPDPPERGG